MIERDWDPDRACLEAVEFYVNLIFALVFLLGVASGVILYSALRMWGVVP